MRVKGEVQFLGLGCGLVLMYVENMVLLSVRFHV